MDKLKAKRRLFNIRFDEEGSHVALVGKNQGGAANGHTVLITKATKNLPNLDQVENSARVQKALEQVEVKLSMEEFLTKFFDMWHSDAEMLTKLLGMQTEYEAYLENAESEPMTHKDYLEERISGISLMKSMSEGSLERISEDDYLKIVKYQQTFEKNGEPMKDDMVNKSLLDESESKVANLEKSLEDVRGELKAAQDELETYKAKEQDAIKAKRTEALSQVLPEDQVETMYKSLKDLDQDSFDVVVKQLGNKIESESSSEMFTEKGVEADAETVESDEDDTLLKMIRKNKEAK